MSVELYDDVDAAAAEPRIRANLPQGLDLLEISHSARLPKSRPGPARYRIDFFAPELFESARLRFAELPEKIEFEKRDRKKKHGPRHKGGFMRKVEREVKSAVSEVESHPSQGGAAWIGFTIEDSETGAISVTDLLKRVLDLPVESWNVGVRLTRMF